eukprot:jgi/Tetstr1/445797/TSEL_033443.t1
MGLANLVGNVPALTRVFTNNGLTDATVAGTTLYVPLQFFFCQSPGLAMPLIALQYHESRIDMEFRPLAECCWTSGFTPSGNMTATGDDWMPYETMRYSPLMQHFMLSERFKNISTSPAYFAAKASHPQRFPP